MQLLLLLTEQLKTSQFYIHEILKSHNYSVSNRAKLLPLHSSILYDMLIPKILNRSHGNFLICFVIFLAPWYALKN